MEKPHVVKFSGGRSSGMMLMNLLEQNILVPERGDVIVFNNTSAEHPATYEFVRKMKKLAEEIYNIPFFWVEYQTYEDANRTGSWVRKPTYRLVNHNPYSKDNPNGYHHKGEVFEELISFNGYVPNILARVCTKSMKIFTTNSFLADWFAQKPNIKRLGHNHKTPRITDDSLVENHKNNGGGVPRKILLDKKKFVRSCPFIRQEQHWHDFTNTDIRVANQELQDNVLGDKAQLYGDDAVDYISYLGIRSDERWRIANINDRIDKAENSRSQSKSLFNQPPGEQVKAPLIENNVTKEGVIEFWKKQAFDLDLPESGLFSNCVYCPLKGQAKLLQIAKEEMKNSPDGKTPELLSWWIRIEKKYNRNLKAEGRKIASDKNPKYVGFFGATKGLIFAKIKRQAMNGKKVDKKLLAVETANPCNCTD